MAGIGWQLERMIGRDTFGGALGAFLTGVAVTSGPWLLTTLVLVAMRISAMNSGATGIQDVERVITVVYATVIVLSAPIDIVLSRYAADRVYERRRDQIAVPLRVALSGCLIGFMAVGAVAMTVTGVPRALLVPGTILASIVAAQWLLLSAAGGLSSPGIILRGFGVGAPISVIAAIALSHPMVFGAHGYLYGYGVGQLVTLGLLLHGTLRALPEAEDASARIAPAFREYWLLAAAAFAFHAGLWADKIVVYVLAGGEVAAGYASTAAVAWLSVVPACAYLFIQIETAFHRRFRSYYSALHTGASLVELERMVGQLRLEVAHTLRGTAAVQASVTLLSVAAATAATPISVIPPEHARTFTWLLIGSGLQVVAMSMTLLLYYFDLRRESFITAAVQLAGNAVMTTWIGAPSPIMGVGYVTACAATCLIGAVLLQRRMAHLLERTFQSQPYASEDYAMRAP